MGVGFNIQWSVCHWSYVQQLSDSAAMLSYIGMLWKEGRADKKSILLSCVHYEYWPAFGQKASVSALHRL